MSNINNIYFNNVAEIGTLYLEYIFYEFESEPILFLCSDEMKKLYICLCSDIRYEQKWIVSKCNINILKSLIKEEMDIVSVFLASKKAIVINMDLQGNENSFETETDKIDRLDLPKKGTFIRCDKEKAQNYLWNKETEMLLDELKAIMDTSPIINENAKTYNTSVYTSINTLNKRAILYKNFITKELIKQPDIADQALEEVAIINPACSISTQKKYVELIDSLDVKGPAADNLLGAA